MRTSGGRTEKPAGRSGERPVGGREEVSGRSGTGKSLLDRELENFEGVGDLDSLLSGGDTGGQRIQGSRVEPHRVNPEVRSAGGKNTGGKTSGGKSGKGSPDKGKKGKQTKRSAVGKSTVEGNSGDDLNFALKRPSGGKIFGTVVFGMLFSAVLVGVCYGGYMNFIKYPRAVQETTENTGLYCLENWEAALKSLSSTGTDSYLYSEIAYANDNQNKVDFYKKMASTVSYAPYDVEDVNVFGNVLLNRKDEVQYRKSTVGEGEYVIMSYIDYDRVEIDRTVVSILMEEADLKVGDVDYPNKLVDVFCSYMNGLKDEELPLKRVRRIPYMVKVDDVYQMTTDEDIYLDRLLFSSNSLYRLMDRFSIVASSLGVENPEWNEWNALSAEEKAGVEEPPRELTEISPTEEWLAWDALSTAEKATSEGGEPDKYNWKEVIDKTWCGTFYLQNEYTTVDENGNVVRKEISAEVGEGSFEDPAGLNTDVVTSIFIKERNEDGEFVEKEYPINVRMVEFGVSENAITWFEDQDDRNRGIDVSSEVQYAYYIFEVTNMSGKELTIYDNSSLSDANANVTSRTGIMYGLQESVTLKPDETGIIETWGRSTELNKRYVIWGADFARRTEPVWFRVLAGDIDDPSENKGVTINDSRRGEEEEVTPSVTESPEEDSSLEEE